jgi:hypothetical protein
LLLRFGQACGRGRKQQIKVACLQKATVGRGVHRLFLQVRGKERLRLCLHIVE